MRLRSVVQTFDGMPLSRVQGEHRDIRTRIRYSSKNDVLAVREELRPGMILLTPRFIRFRDAYWYAAIGTKPVQACIVATEKNDIIGPPCRTTCAGRHIRNLHRNLTVDGILKIAP